MDFEDALLEHPDAFLFLDPPYLNTHQNLYGKGGYLHRHFDHRRLAAILHSSKGWVLCLNDCAEVRRLYDGHTIVGLEVDYSMSRTKHKREVLIISD